MEIMKLNKELQSIVHQQDEDVRKDKTHVVCNRSIQKLQQDVTRLNKVLNSIKPWSHICPSTY
jgi:predicted RNase H-like nuclease (RuvC/YqgF family)